MVAPPPVVVTTATRGAPRRVGTGTRASSGRPSIRPSSVVDPRDAAIGEERVGDVVLAGERAGVRHRELARGFRAAELVGDDRLAALGRGEREARAARRRCAWFRGTARSRRCRDRRASRRRSRRARDRPRCRPRPGRRSRCRAPCRATAACRSCCRNARRRRCGRPAGPVSSKAALAVSIARVRRSTMPRLDGPTTRMPVVAQMSRSRATRAVALRAGFGEAVGEHGRDLHAEPAAFRDRLDRGVGRRHDIGVVGRFRQRRERRPGALAQHLVAAAD